MPTITASSPMPWRKDKRLAVIDADGLLYAAALEGQTMCDGEPLQLLDEEAVYRRALERLASLVEMLGECSLVFLALSARNNFRKELLPSYKENRKGAPRPLMLDALRGDVIAAKHDYPVFLIDRLEADDVCGIVATRFQAEGYETVIVSPDKDMLQIPGVSVTFKGVLSEVSPERADYWHLWQTLVGDTVDNYKGCPGIGPKKAEALLDHAFESGWSIARIFEEIVERFEAKGLSREDALTQARVARILRGSDWDAEKKEVKLWTPC